MARRSPPDQPSGQVRLAARERQDAAAVVRAEVRAGQLVRDVEVTRGRRRVGRADRHAHPARTTAGVVHGQLPLREVDLERQWASQQPQLRRARPADLGVPECGAAHRDPLSLSERHRERLRRAELRSRADAGNDVTAGTSTQGDHAAFRHPGGQPANELEPCGGSGFGGSARCDGESSPQPATPSASAAPRMGR